MNKPTARVLAATVLTALVVTTILPLVSGVLPGVYSTVGRTWA